MKLIKFLLLALSLIIYFTGCHRELEKNKSEIFSLESLLDSQIKLLSINKLQLKKETHLGDNIENLIITPDSSAWAKELSIFRTADINKPGLKDFYDKDVVEIGNIEKEEYFLLDSNQSETIYLRIHKDNKSGIISSIEALQHIKNPIYQSQRKLVLNFKQNDDETIRLDSFAIKGYQKMILQDSVNYFTGGKILTNNF